MGSHGSGIPWVPWVSHGNGNESSHGNGNGMGMGMKSMKWEGIGTKNQFPHISTMGQIPRSTERISSTYCVHIIFRFLATMLMVNKDYHKLIINKLM